MERVEGMGAKKILIKMSAGIKMIHPNVPRTRKRAGLAGLLAAEGRVRD